MKYIIVFFLLVSIGCILTGYIMDFDNSQKFIGFGVLGLFFIVFPLFSYHRWKDKNVKDYMLTKESLDKMREREGDTKR